MAFSNGGGSSGVRSDINITPLVDVVLVLLIIFMVMTPTLLKQLPVQVPDKDDSAPSTPAGDQLVVGIDAAGALSLDGERLSREELVNRVRTRLSGHGDRVVFFDIDDRASYGLSVEVIDECRGAGAQVLGMVTRRP